MQSTSYRNHSKLFHRVRIPRPYTIILITNLFSTPSVHIYKTDTFIIDEVTIEIIDIGLPPISHEPQTNTNPGERLIVSKHSNSQQQQTVMNSRMGLSEDEDDEYFVPCHEQQPVVNLNPSDEQDLKNLEQVMEEEAIFEALLEAGTMGWWNIVAELVLYVQIRLTGCRGYWSCWTSWSIVQSQGGDLYVDVSILIIQVKMTGFDVHWFELRSMQMTSSLWVSFLGINIGKDWSSFNHVIRIIFHFANVPNWCIMPVLGVRDTGYRMSLTWNRIIAHESIAIK